MSMKIGYEKPDVVFEGYANELELGHALDTLWNPSEVFELLTLSNASLFAKRIIDFAIALVSLVILTPLFVAIATLIKLDTPGPVIFRQTRIGKNGKTFNFYKFRTMVEDAEQQKEGLVWLNEATGPLFKIKNDPRITKTGSWLRKTSLDELPQLFNVIKGEMSLVGPRPALPDEVNRYNALSMKRLLVMPGMTGVWQVNGRSNATFEEMINYDLRYIKDWSLWTDIKILFKTIPAVLKNHGAY
jgi:exopolysaccharide biosynthesis polyprenyl glycosylphosphotransferase